MHLQRDPSSRVRGFRDDRNVAGMGGRTGDYSTGGKNKQVASARLQNQ